MTTTIASPFQQLLSELLKPENGKATTQAKLAAAISMSPGRLSKIVNGIDPPPDVAVCRNIAKFFGPRTSPEALIAAAAPERARRLSDSKDIAAVFEARIADLERDLVVARENTIQRVLDAEARFEALLAYFRRTDAIDKFLFTDEENCARHEMWKVGNERDDDRAIFGRGVIALFATVRQQPHRLHWLPEALDTFRRIRSIDARFMAIESFKFAALGAVTAQEATMNEPMPEDIALHDFKNDRVEPGPPLVGVEVRHIPDATYVERTIEEHIAEFAAQWSGSAGGGPAPPITAPAAASALPAPKPTE
ncbi:MAG: helix-turn-helix domain-containing protein [Myxococcales bacterium]|nr:helix-turn-helix domain-containing protein [Myxococcales bacterium]